MTEPDLFPGPSRPTLLHGAPKPSPARFGAVTTLLGLFGVAALLALFGLGVFLDDPAFVHRRPSGAAAASAPADGATGDTPGLEMRRVFLGQGGTLATVLDRLGLERAEHQEVLRMVGRYLDPRRLSPKTGVVAAVDSRGRAHHVSVRSEPERFLRVTLPQDEPDRAPGAELIRLPVTTSIEMAGGVVDSSVAQALSFRAHAPQLTQAYADIFQWAVDLLVDPRPGDTVRLVFEVHRLGEVPDDLPSFGNAADEPGQFLSLGRILAASYEGQIAIASAFWIDDGDAGGNFYDERGLPLRKSFLKSPLNYRRISSGFSRSRRHPVTRKVVPHHGVDFAAAPGTPVVATADGRVASAGWDGALGRALRVRHGGEYVTVYGHLQSFASGVRAGAEVRQSQVIGFVGSTGRATGPHLHYTVLRYGRPINPLRMENPPAEPLQATLRPWLEESKRRWISVLDAIPLTEPDLQVAGRLGEADAQTAILPGL